jgi:hypothetical protein
MEQRRWRGSLVGPIILIGLGIVFLLNNLGWLNRQSPIARMCNFSPS